MSEARKSMLGDQFSMHLYSRSSAPFDFSFLWKPLIDLAWFAVLHAKTGNWYTVPDLYRLDDVSPGLVVMLPKRYIIALILIALRQGWTSQI